MHINTIFVMGNSTFIDQILKYTVGAVNVFYWAKDECLRVIEILQEEVHGS